MWDQRDGSQGMVKSLGPFRNMQQDQPQPKGLRQQLGEVELCQPQAPDPSLQGRALLRTLHRQPGAQPFSLLAPLQILYLHINHFPRQGGLWVLFSFDYLNIVFHLIFQKTCKERAQKSQHRITSGASSWSPACCSARTEASHGGVTRLSDTRAFIPVRTHSHHGMNTPSLLAQ